MLVHCSCALRLQTLRLRFEPEHFGTDPVPRGEGEGGGLGLRRSSDTVRSDVA